MPLISPPSISSTLTINGTNYDAAQRQAARIVIDGWGWDLDADFSLQFHEAPGGSAPQWLGGATVSLTINGAVVFTGSITDTAPMHDADGWVYGYTAQGLKYAVNWLPVVNPQDYSGSIAFNLPPTDFYWVPSMAGLSVGAILSQVLTDHATALAAIGVTTDSTTTSQLAALTLVPREPVYFAGERLGNAIDAVLQRDARNIDFYVQPTGVGSGVARFVDINAGTAHTLTLGSDPVMPTKPRRSIKAAATRTIVRGKGNIYPGYVSLLKSTLTPAWTSAQQSAWTWADFVSPVGAFDSGTIPAGGITSTTTITVQSSNAGETWGVNYWPPLEAWIHVINSVGTGLTYQEARPVTSNTALAAGGTSTITVGYALDNSGSSAYSSYEIIGTYSPLSSGNPNNRCDVWRLFDVTDPGLLIADHLVRAFPTPQPFFNYGGSGAVLTLYPMAVVANASGDTFPATFKILPESGQILFDEPIIKSLNSISTLTTGGSAVTAPTDIYMLLAYSRGPLQAIEPPNSGSTPVYAGTAYTVEGLERTGYVDVDAWIYAGDTPTLQAYASMIQASTQDTIIDGTVNYLGAYTSAFAPGITMNLAGPGSSAIDQTMNCPVRRFFLRYLIEGREGLNYRSELGLNSRRNRATGDSFFSHLSHWQVGQAAWSPGGQSAPFGPAAPFSDPAASQGGSS
ncbi:MAG: hypothetical protein KGM43_06335 [Planctomycetota bacterium]|nr:hypothetical protein [Planctomycetota bacterium]